MISILDVLQYFAFSAIFIGFIVFIAIVCAVRLIIDEEDIRK